MDDFVSNFLIRINGKIADNELEIIKKELVIFIDNYTISPKSTELAPYVGLSKAYQIYMVTKKIEGRSDGTLRLYRLYLEHMFNTIGKQVEDISANDIRLYLYQLRETGNISDRTLNNRRVIINTFFDWCCKEGYIKNNPCTNINAIKYEIKLREPFTELEMEVIRNSCKSLKEKALIEFLFSTGCRVSELCGVRLDDVNYVTKEVKLFGKGKKHRISYINAKAEIALKEYLASRNDPTEYLFVSDKHPHDKLTTAAIEKILRNLGKRTGMKIYPHRFRHTFATVALNRGMPLAEVQCVLGHSSIDTTLIYAKISQDSVAKNHKKCLA